ncbi:MAG: hypothetical protein E7618_01620 [Ruminococcaceae bacterium]|nr:hypothetical protein [Oscillospiraceae bacterium]
MKRNFLVSILALILLLTAFGCGPAKLEISEEQALAVLQDLVPRSYEINVILFGNGLPTEDHAGTGAADGAIYYPVTEDCGYRSTAEIKRAAEKIYSARYLSGIYVFAFTGVHSDEEDSNLDLSVSPRYRDLAEQGLCVNVTVKPIAIRGRLEVLSVTVGKRTSTYVATEVTCRDESGNTLTLHIPLTKENGVWLLDGPTY